MNYNAFDGIEAPVFVSHNPGSPTKPKRFALFAWPKNRARGGWEDLRGSAGTVVEALVELEARQSEKPAEYECWQIIDLQLGKATGCVNERSSGGLRLLQPD